MRFPMRRAGATCAALLMLLRPSIAGDILITKDGRVFETDTMARVEGGIDITFKNGVVHVPDRMIQDAVLATDAAIPPVSDEEKEKASKGFVRFEGQWVPLKRRDELVAKKVADKHKALEEMRAHEQWGKRYIEESKVFHYEYTVPPAVFADFRDAMEAYYAQFVKAWKITPPRGAPKLPVNIYIDAKSYHQIAGAPDGALAYFRFVKPWDLNTYYDRLDDEYSKHVLYHEANHYLQLLIEPNFAMTHFPGESVAEYYGASHWDPATKKFETGLIQEGRLCEIQSDIAAGDKYTLETLISTPEMYEHYTWGWSLVHFLMNDARYAAKFQKFFLTLSSGRGIVRDPFPRDNLTTLKQPEVWKIFQSEMGLKDGAAVRKMETEWYDHIDKLGVVSAAGLVKAAMSATESAPPRLIRARRFFKEAIEKGSQNPVAFEKYAALLDENGETAQALEMLEKAIEIDPLEGKFYNRKGHRMLRHKNAEGDRWVALGEELGFDDDWVDISDVDPKKKKDKGN
jgi:tetratricopeptide (TPR) repeat protein